MTRMILPALLCSCLCLSGLAHGEEKTKRVSGGTSKFDAGNGDANQEKELRLREGTKLLERTGKFQNSGDRIVFTTDEGESYRVLENLMLERVSNSMNEARTERKWSISGIVTEFRGANFLMLQKALIVEREQNLADGVRER